MLAKSTRSGKRKKEGRRGEKGCVNSYETCAKQLALTYTKTCPDESLLKECGPRPEKPSVCYKTGALFAVSNSEVQKLRAMSIL